MPLLLFLFSLTLPALAQSDWDKSRTDANEAYRDGRYTQAEALLKRALEAARNLGPDDPQRHLASGRADGARHLSVSREVSCREQGAFRFL